MSDNEMDITERVSDNNSDDDDNNNMDEEEVDDDDDNDDDNENTNTNNDKKTEVYLPGKPLQDGEELVCDQTAYKMLHQAQTGAPCLSFDIIPDNLGDNRETYPLTAYIVAGTQAPQTHCNNIIVMKLSNLYQTNKSDDDDDDDDDDDSDDDDDDGIGKEPKMNGALIRHQGCVNRIRSTVLNGKVIVASWSELGRVNIWDITQQLQVVDNEQLLKKYNNENCSNTIKPIFTFNGHQKEGFALDWCKTTNGYLASGDCHHDIHIWRPYDNLTKWHIDQRPLIGHKDSIEDLQWSPNECNVLASCSIDRSIRIWDIRANPTKANMLTNDNAHELDINVINWNNNEPFIISGGDDGYLHIWDLRRFHTKTPIATFKHHTEPITTVEWHPNDSAIFASGGSDNQIALWDLSVEKDTDIQENNINDNEIEGIPPQLLFIHQGQNNIKELHWHPQLPGVIISTAESGFNIFRTISV